MLALPLPQQATVMQPMYLDDLTGASQTVVYGRVLASRVEWDAAHRWLYTIYTIQPQQYLKGGLGATFELREPGGELGGEGMRVESAPHFQVGQEALLFVWTSPDGSHQVTAFEQGAVAVVTDLITGAKVAARPIPLGRAAQKATASRSLSELSLDALFHQVRSSVARTAQPAAGE